MARARIYEAPRNPTTTDNSAAGFGFRHTWVNTASGERFVMIQESNGVAAWRGDKGGSGATSVIHLRGSSTSSTPAVLLADSKPFVIPEGAHLATITILAKRRDGFSFAKWERSTVLVNMPGRLSTETGIAAYSGVEQRTTDLATWVAGNPVTITANATTKALDIVVTNVVTGYTLTYVMDYVAKVELLTI